MAVAELVSVGVGGVGGALVRWYVSGRLGGGVRGTLAVNVLGSFCLGVLTAAGVDGNASLVAAVGFCGAFTTFSSFAVETVRLAEDDPARAAANAAANLGVALAAVVAGVWIAGVGVGVGG